MYTAEAEEDLKEKKTEQKRCSVETCYGYLSHRGIKRGQSNGVTVEIIPGNESFGSRKGRKRTKSAKKRKKKRPSPVGFP